MPGTARVFLRRLIHERVPGTLHRPVAAGRVRGEPPARAPGDLSRLLPRLDREIAGRLEDARPLATAPGAEGRPVFGLMAPARLALLPAPTGPAAPHLLPALLGLPLVASGLVEVSHFHRAFPVAGPLRG